MDKQFLQIQGELSELKKITLLGAKNVLTVEDVSFLTGLSVKRLYSLTSLKQIPHFKREGCRTLYFDKAEIENWMKGYRVVTEAEAIQAAANYNLASSGL